MVVEHFAFEEDELLSTACERYLNGVLDGLQATDAQRAAVFPVFRQQAAYWGDRRCDVPPITRATMLGSPLECSAVLEDGEPEIRWVAELLGPQQTLSAYREASFDYLEQLAKDGVPLAGELRQKLAEIPHFHMLHGVVCAPGGAITHKLYLHAWHHLGALRSFPWKRLLETVGAKAFAKRLDALCSPSEYLSFVCIDLIADSPRVKVYINVPPSQGGAFLERLAAAEALPSVEPVAEFRRVVKQGADQISDFEVFSLVTRLGDDAGRFEQLTFALSTRSHCVAPYVERVPSLGSDAFFLEGLSRFATNAGLSVARIMPLLDRLLPEPLADSHYFFTFFSYQERKIGAPRVTAYFSPPFFLSEVAGFLSSPQNRLST